MSTINSCFDKDGKIINDKYSKDLPHLNDHANRILEKSIKLVELVNHN